MELRHLKYFVAVAEEQSISRAAARLNIAAPPLKRQIRTLEKKLGVSLFTRDPSEVHLTAAGRAYLREALDILSRVAVATRRVRGYSDHAASALNADANACLPSCPSTRPAAYAVP